MGTKGKEYRKTKIEGNICIKQDTVNRNNHVQSHRDILQELKIDLTPVSAMTQSEQLVTSLLEGRGGARAGYCYKGVCLQTRSVLAEEMDLLVHRESQNGNKKGGNSSWASNPPHWPPLTGPLSWPAGGQWSRTHTILSNYRKQKRCHAPHSQENSWF